jgi:hypothetical protein
MDSGEGCLFVNVLSFFVGVDLSLKG